MDKQIYTATEAAEYLGITGHLLRKMCLRGDINSTMLHGRRYFTKPMLDRFVSRLQIVQEDDGETND